MNLIYFTKDAYKLLKKDLDVNKDKYYRDDPWLSEYFAKVELDEFYKTSSIVVSNLQLSCSGDDVESKNNDDLLNIKLLYSDYKDKITPLQASDPLLWSALCHIPLRNMSYNVGKKMTERLDWIKGFLRRKAVHLCYITMLFHAYGGLVI